MKKINTPLYPILVRLVFLIVVLSGFAVHQVFATQVTLAKPVSVGTYQGLVRQMSFHPTGNYLLAATGVSGTEQTANQPRGLIIYKKNASGTWELCQQVICDECHAAGWSPDGKYLAYSNSGTEIIVCAFNDDTAAQDRAQNERDGFMTGRLTEKARFQTWSAVKRIAWGPKKDAQPYRIAVAKVRDFKQSIAQIFACLFDEKGEAKLELKAEVRDLPFVQHKPLYASSVAWHPDGKSIVVGCAPAVSLSQDNGMMFSVSDDGSLTMPSAQHAFKMNSALWDAAFAVQGSNVLLACGGDAMVLGSVPNYAVGLVQANSRLVIADANRQKEGAGYDALAVAWHPKRPVVAYASYSAIEQKSVVRLFSVGAQGELTDSARYADADLPPGPIMSLAWTLDGSALLCGTIAGIKMIPVTVVQPVEQQASVVQANQAGPAVLNKPYRIKLGNGYLTTRSLSRDEVSGAHKVVYTVDPSSAVEFTLVGSSLSSFFMTTSHNAYVRCLDPYVFRAEGTDVLSTEAQIELVLDASLASTFSIQEVKDSQNVRLRVLNLRVSQEPLDIRSFDLALVAGDQIGFYNSSSNATLELSTIQTTEVAFINQTTLALHDKRPTYFRNELFDAHLMTAKIDFLLSSMMRVARSGSTTKDQNTKFLRSGQVLVDNYHLLTPQQRSRLITALN